MSVNLHESASQRVALLDMRDQAKHLASWVWGTGPARARDV
jgi:hypothetical protein